MRLSERERKTFALCTRRLDTVVILKNVLGNKHMSKWHNYYNTCMFLINWKQRIRACGVGRIKAWEWVLRSVWGRRLLALTMGSFLSLLAVSIGSQVILPTNSRTARTITALLMLLLVKSTGSMCAIRMSVINTSEQIIKAKTILTVELWPVAMPVTTEMIVAWNIWVRLSHYRVRNWCS